MRNSRAWLWLAALTLSVWVGCDQATTSPDDVGAAGSALSPSFGSLSGADQNALKRLLESEEQRIRAAEELSEAVYDSLKAVWRSSDGDSELTVCEPLQYDADVRIIGPDGGTLNIGPHRLTIPRGALTKHTVITGELPVSFHVSVKLSPSGLHFLKPLQLKLSYKHCVGEQRYRHSVVYVNDLGEIVEWPASFDYTSYEEVWGTIWHFSKYAVASN